MAKNTIVMWGSGRNSEDTQRKLSIYDDYRKNTHKGHRLYTDTVTFEQPLDGTPINMPVPVHPNVGRSWGWETRNGKQNLSAAIKRQGYKNVYGNDLDTLFDYEPYVDLSTLPTSKRPYSFVQCVDFFYPMSGKNSYLPTQSPLVSTWPNAYDNTFTKHPIGIIYTHNPPTDGFVLDKSTMPVDLGEITMMYFWFNIYKLILCPSAYKNYILPNDPFQIDKDNDNKRSVFPELVRSARATQQAALSSLQQLKTVFKVASSVAQSIASSDLTQADISRKLESLMEDTDELFEKGLTKIAKLFSDDAGIDLVDSNTIINFFTSGSISPKVLKTLSSEGLDTLNVNVNRMLIEEASGLGISFDNDLKKTDRQYLKALSKFGSDVSSLKLSDVASATSGNGSLTAERTFLEILKDPSKQRNLSPQAKRIAKKIKADQLPNTPSVKKAFQHLKNARPNGLITVAVLTGASLAFNAYVSHKEKEINKLAKAIRNFASTSVARLDPRFAEDTVEFVIDNDFSLGNGVKGGAGWKVKPTCGVVLGAFFKRYCTEAYKEMKPIIHEARTYYNVRETMKGFNLKSRLNPRYYLHGGRDNNIIKWKGGRGFCRPFDLFSTQKAPTRSTKTVLEDLQSFSPFTQAFGWEPTFLSTRTSDADGKKELNPGRTNYDVGVFGSPVNKGKVFGTSKYGAWVAPGQHYKYTFVTSHKRNKRSTGGTAHWKTKTIQTDKGNYHLAGKTKKGGHQKTVNSQRKLNSAVPYGYGGFTDLNFDVATGVPIFNAQWVAATSVIFCHAEALKNLADMGYGWATKLYRGKTAEVVRTDDTTLKTIKFVNKWGSKSGQNKSNLSKTIQAGKKPAEMVRTDDTTFKAMQSVFGSKFGQNLSYLSKGIQAGKKPKTFIVSTIPFTSHLLKNRGGTKTASDDASTPIVPEPKKAKDKPLTNEQDVNKLAIQLGVSTISVGMLAILALKLRKM